MLAGDSNDKINCVVDQFIQHEIGIVEMQVLGEVEELAQLLHGGRLGAQDRRTGLRGVRRGEG